MKTKLLLVTFLLSVNLAATFSAPQQQSESASKILALEDKWNEVRHNPWPSEAESLSQAADKVSG